MFRDYQSSLQSTPGVWQRAAQQAGNVAKATTAAANATHTATTASHDIVVIQAQAARQASNQARSWHNMARDAGKFSLHIADATRSLLRWGALTGLVSGILGVGGLFGIERLALSAGNQRAQGLALGMKPGDAKAFETNLGSRGYNTDAFLGNINKGLLDLTSPQFLGLRGLGFDYGRDLAGKDTSTVALDALTKLKQQVDQIPLGPLFEPTAKARQLDQLMSMEDIERLRRTPTSEVGDYAKRIREDQQSMSLTGQTAKAWQDLNAQLTRAGTTLQNVLIEKLVALAPQIDHLSSAFTKAVSDLLSRPELKEWIESLAKGIGWLANYIGTDEFKNSVIHFVEGIQKVATAIWDLVNAFIDAGTAVRNWFNDPDKFNRNGPLSDDNPRAPGSPAFNEQRFGKDNSSSGIRTPWNSGGWYKWWHGEEEAPPPSAIQKQSFDRLEGEQGLPPGLLNGVFQAESGGGRNLYSPAGAVGPFQFTRGAWEQYGGGGSPLSFNDSATASARYFHKLLDEFHGDVAKAAAGYNAGEGNVEKAIQMYGENWRRGLPKPEETLPYIDKVVRALGNKVPTNNRSGGANVMININNNTGGNAVVSSSQLSV